MTNQPHTPCRSKTPESCRFHNPSKQAKLNSAKTYQEFEEAKKLVELERKKNNGAFIHDEMFRNVKKMPALFVINRVAHVATQEVNEASAWIFDEVSHATLKKDGTSITVAEDGTVFARRAVKKGKAAPEGFIPAETDSFTGSTFGIEPIHQSGFAKMFQEAVGDAALTPGTYELCGPKINGNPESLTTHQILAHGSEEALEVPDMRTVSKEEAYETLKSIFAQYKKQGVEGVVWWGANGKRTKLRVKDFFGDPSRS